MSKFDEMVKKLDAFDAVHDCDKADRRVQGGDLAATGVSVYACDTCAPVVEDIIGACFDDIRVHPLPVRS